jgi:hypothetical protein
LFREAFKAVNYQLDIASPARKDAAPGRIAAFKFTWRSKICCCMGREGAEWTWHGAVHKDKEMEFLTELAFTANPQTDLSSFCGFSALMRSGSFFYAFTL